MTSYVYLGPFRAWDQLNEGILVALDGTISEGSGEITVSTLSAKSHEQTISATARAFGTWKVRPKGGRQLTLRRRARGGSLVVKLSNGETARRWGVDNVMATLEDAGRSRQ